MLVRVIFLTYFLKVGAFTRPHELRAILATTNDAASVCGSNDYMIIDDYCYQALVGSQNWFRAEIECQKDGGQLISLSGNIKNNSIATHVQYLTGCYDSWTGLVDVDPSAALMKNRASWEWIDNSGTIDAGLFEAANIVADTCSACGYLLGSPVSATQCSSSQTGIKNAPCAATSKRAVCRKPAKRAAATTVSPPKKVVCEGNSGWFPWLDSRKNEGNCYLKVDHPVDRFAAEEHCSKEGGTLVSIRSKEEQAVVTYLSQCCPVWVGFEYTDDRDLCKEKDPVKDEEWKWNWVDIAQYSDAESCIHYSNWMQYPTPSDIASQKLCAYMGQGGFWYSDYCITRRGFMCKKKGRIV